ncbi:hypothetical protein BU16DRAFT_555605 [Lophium mytilinum]|uniref:Ubiquitin 3 binding protein But2 C-terminal domain-containing protein n=1 Tax=Lophium mytilinum TaxID=390894 RepID=A0A6A6R9P1_9PEZI|nr:hypothetical protein BU16DRAFT_555605 [Lophium mytilinum]
MRFFSLLPFAILWAQPSIADLVSREFPHLIIPLKQDYPTTPFGTQYSGEITVVNGAHQVWTEISFDVPSNSARSCHLAVTIATGSQGAPWTLTGNNPSFNIFEISTAMDQFRDAWNQNTRPAVHGWVATFDVHYDGTVTMTGGDVVCNKGGLAQYLIEPNGGQNVGFTWFEEADPVHGITYEMYD